VQVRNSFDKFGCVELSPRLGQAFLGLPCQQLFQVPTYDPVFHHAIHPEHKSWKERKNKRKKKQKKEKMVFFAGGMASVPITRCGHVSPSQAARELQRVFF
jgi:hypothetical protein